MLLLPMTTFAQSPWTPTLDEVQVADGVTHFSLFAPEKAKSVKLRIYKDATSPKPEKTVTMKLADDARWHADIQADLTGRFYTFQVNGMKECAGIFAKAVAANGRRACVINLRDTDPEGWQSDCRPMVRNAVDHIIYEMHHRDFSIDPSSGLKNKGKFLALTEPKAIEHLKRLGINAVHILPSFDYASIDETRLDENRYNWGYDPLNYNVPEGSYSTDPTAPATRIREFKQMVQALHSAGIRVILDVVYNHTFNTLESNFHLTYPGYFFRHRPDGTDSDGSGCGNETASEQPMMRRFMIESTRYWLEEYHIDGFRFDLMGIHDMETMRLIRAEADKLDPTILIYGEGWSAGSCAYPQEQLAMKATTYQMPGIAAFSDDIRDALRGPFSDDHQTAFLGGIAGHEESLRYGIAGCIDHPQVDITKVNYSKRPFAAQPGQAVAYVSCHDDMCLVDRLKASIPELSDKHRNASYKMRKLISLDLLAQTAVMTSQGIPFILSGEEMLRDKKGVHNSYCSPDSINRLDWGNLKRYPQVIEYYSGLTALRHAHPAFRLADADLVRRHLEFLPTADCIVAFRLKDLQGIDPWSEIIVVLNSNATAQTVSIPDGWWTVVAQDGKINLAGLGVAHGPVATVPAQSAMILHK